jgi:hypothetical protein
MGLKVCGIMVQVIHEVLLSSFQKKNYYEVTETGRDNTGRKICICIKYVDGSTSGLYFDGVGCAMRPSKNVGEQF